MSKCGDDSLSQEELFNKQVEADWKKQSCIVA